MTGPRRAFGGDTVAIIALTLRAARGRLDAAERGEERDAATISEACAFVTLHDPDPARLAQAGRLAATLTEETET